MAQYRIRCDFENIYVYADHFKKLEIDLGLKYKINRFKFFKNGNAVMELPCSMVDEIYLCKLMSTDELMFRRDIES